MRIQLHSISMIIPLMLFLFLSVSASSATSNESFVQCFSSHTNTTNSDVIFSPSSSHYQSIFQLSVRNLRFSNASKPQFLITPYSESHVQAAIICSKQHQLHIRVRSGGHDYEGLSYTSVVPFIIIDLLRIRSITLDLKNEHAWVGAGATVGELYYTIANSSNIHGFPAGSCPTVGVGGHFSGGGFGTIFRKYGLAADNVVDVKMVDVNGKVLDRKSMGEDLFWAIRGGGGSSFGVIFSWKLKLVRVPPTVTVFTVGKTVEQGANKLLQKWQTIGHKLNQEIFLHVVLGVTDSNSNSNSNKTIQVSFDGLFLGTAQSLLPLLNESFPELELDSHHCTEMSWIQSVLYFAGFSITERSDILTNRTTPSSFFKAKSDYVKEPIPATGLEGLYKILMKQEISPILILTPYGGKMSQIPSSETPFPYRGGNLYAIQYIVYWDDANETRKQIEEMRRLYKYMEPYVSKSPRAAYFNYRDLDLGTNINRNTSYSQAASWGFKYFSNNFNRLVRVKTSIDPHNFFWDEQSIPVLSMLGRNNK